MINQSLLIKIGTVCFLKSENKVLLFLIEYPDGVQRWNGIGGFVYENETPEDALIREAKEEINLTIEKQNIKEIKRIDYPIKNLQLFVFLCDVWQGELKLLDLTIKEYKWFSFDEIPYDKMWFDNKEWLPEILLSS